LGTLRNVGIRRTSRFVVASKCIFENEITFKFTL